MRSEGLLTRFFSSEINVSKERKNERTFESSRFEIVDFQIRNGLNCRGTPAPTPSDPRGSETSDLKSSEPRGSDAGKRPSPPLLKKVSLFREKPNNPPPLSMRLT